jgi:ribonuclease E
VALYILNQKRHSLVQLETRYDLRVLLARDDSLIPPAFRLERLRTYSPAESAVLPAAPLTQAPEIEGDDEEIDEEEAEIVESDRLESGRQEQDSDEEPGRSRRRRKRRRRRDEEPGSALSPPQAEIVEDAKEEAGESAGENAKAGSDDGDGDGESDAEGRRRRRGRRGGRRRTRREGGFEPAFAEPPSSPDLVEVLSTSDAEERAPALVEAVMSAPAEAGPAAVEPVGAEFGSTAHGPPGGIEIVREIEPVTPERVAATGEIQSGVPITGELAGSARPHFYSLETTAPLAGGGLPEAAPTASSAAEARLSISEAERVPEEPSPDRVAPKEPAPPVQQADEKPANPRRGWWQRLIQS